MKSLVGIKGGKRMSWELTKKLYSTDDARVWADEFVKVVVEGGLTINRDLMITWFANALTDLKYRKGAIGVGELQKEFDK